MTSLDLKQKHPPIWREDLFHESSRTVDVEHPKDVDEMFLKNNLTNVVSKARLGI